ncbi:ran-binding protein 3 [Dermacentor variabilis]|uniref:ran-binding protein 3 n=1 Tax=Dermacentor variabilis TaxID=34621 RepID=UPI003F5BBDD3
MAEKGGSPGNGDSGLVSSSCLSSGAGMLGLSRIQQNPFAIKTTTPTRSVADSTENKETKPIVAPPTLVLGADNACAVSSSGSRIVLRPSALAFQAEKLKQTSPDAASTEPRDNTTTATATKEQQHQQQAPSASRDPREVSSTCESTTSPVTNGTRTSGTVSSAEDDNSGSTTTSSSGRAVGESSSSFGLALGDLRNGTSSSEHLSTLGTGGGLLSSATDDANHSPHAAAPPDGFVFGENLRERAANFEDASSDSSIAPTSTELSFQQFQQQAGQSSAASTEQPPDVACAASRHAKSLTESAEEYQLRQVKRTYDEVAVVTGEENEFNVLQINCKLFTFDKTTSSWQERGRGSLRLNDQEVDGVLQSRMVMRTQGSLRVILNTKVWSGMVVEHPSSKTVRTTAIDPDGIRVYLIQANGKDAEQLYGALECRVASLKAAEDSGSGVLPMPAAMQGLPPSADSSSSFPESVGSLEDDGASQSKRPRLQESDGSLPDSSHGEDSVATAECESSAEDKG